jgi:Mrp family chromosome partitioning ATPase
MSLLEQAFVKAYGRSQAKTASTDGVAAPHLDSASGTSGAASPASINEHLRGTPAADPTMMLGDLLDDTYFRVDVSHTPILRVSRQSIAAQNHTDGSRIAGVDPPVSPSQAPRPVARVQQTPTRVAPATTALRFHPQPVNSAAISHTLTAYEQSSAINAARTATPPPAVTEAAPASVSSEPPREVTFFRVDESHRQRRLTPAPAEDFPVLRRVNVDIDEATAFARAKSEAYAREMQIEADRKAIALQQLAAAKQAAEQMAMAVEITRAEAARAERERAGLKKAEEQKLAEKKLAEQLLAEIKLAEQQIEEQKLEELRQEQHRLAEQQLAEQKFAEQKLAEQKLVEQKLAEQKLVEQRLAELEVALQQKAVLEAQIAAEKESAAAALTATQNASESAALGSKRQKAPFAAVWEVDAFEFSDTIVELFGNAQLMKSIGAPLDRAVADGLRSILITSAERGVGRTSVAIGIAVSAASAGLKVAIVDADVTHAGLADALHLDIQNDWLDALRAGLPIDEVTIRSIEDQLTVIPAIRSRESVACQTEQFDDMLSLLRDSFDLVIIDASPWFDSVIPIQNASTIDAAIVVVDATKPNPSLINQLQNNLRHAGVAGLGVVENFS